MLWHGETQKSDESTVLAVRIDSPEEFNQAEMFWKASDEQENFMFDLSDNKTSWRAVNDTLRRILKESRLTAPESPESGKRVGRLRMWYRRSAVVRRVAVAIAGAGGVGAYAAQVAAANNWSIDGPGGIVGIILFAVGAMLAMDRDTKEWESSTGTKRSAVFPEIVTKPAVPVSDAENSLAKILEGNPDAPLPPGV